MIDYAQQTLKLNFHYENETYGIWILHCNVLDTKYSANDDNIWIACSGQPYPCFIMQTASFEKLTYRKIMAKVKLRIATRVKYSYYI